jgi:hypothetical protein
MGGLLSGLLSGLFSGYAANKAKKEAEALAQGHMDSTNIDVTGTMGNYSSQDGQIDMSLSPEFQNLFDTYLGGIDTQSDYIRELEAGDGGHGYAEDLRSLQAPEDARQQVALQNRMLAQGLGQSTHGGSMFGELLGAQQRKGQEAEILGQDRYGQDLSAAYARRDTTLANLLNLGSAPMDLASVGLKGAGLNELASQTGVGLMSEGSLNRTDAISGFGTALAGSIGNWGS